MKLSKQYLSITAVLLASLSPAAKASLSTSFQFNGNGNWSLDGVGTSTTGTIDAFVPVGSTVVKAFLYSSQFSLGGLVVPSVNFDGTTISGASWTAQGVTGSGGVNLQAYRTDVTSQVAAKIGGGNAAPFSFNISNEIPSLSTNGTDGEVLAIIYSNPAESLRTIAFLDGFSATTGDTTNVNLGAPLTATQLADPNFQALLSLGIGFGFQPSNPSQVSLVDVNGQRLTSSAGGQDDANDSSSNGSLLTIGGIGDSINNPSPFAPAINFSSDDELYSLKPFLSAGNSSITINTLNPTNDDNIFFAGVNITAQANVSGVPDGGATIAMLGLALTGIAGLRKKFGF